MEGEEGWHGQTKEKEKQNKNATSTTRFQLVGVPIRVSYLEQNKCKKI